MPRTTDCVEDEQSEMKTFYNDVHKKLSLETTTGTPYPTHVNFHNKHVKQKKVLDTKMTNWEPGWNESGRSTVRKRLLLPAGYTNDNKSYVVGHEQQGYYTPNQEERRQHKSVTLKIRTNPLLK